MEKTDGDKTKVTGEPGTALPENASWVNMHYEKRYSKKAFWLIKIIMLIALAVWYGNLCRESGRQEALRVKPMQYIEGGVPFCSWSGLVYPAVEFNTKKMIVKIKKETH